MTINLSNTNPEYFVYVSTAGDISVGDGAYFDSSGNLNSGLINSLYVNTFNIFNTSSITTSSRYIKGTTGVGSVRLFVDFDSPSGTADISIYNTPYTVNYTQEFLNDSNYLLKRNITNLTTPNTSYMLLRTNPKLTGNIKVVVSGSYLYLDTFKVSPILSAEKYSHVKVSGQNYYGNDIYNTFKSLPQGEIYKVNTDNYDVFSSKSSYSDQYVTTYNYGVSNNFNKLYSENYAMLAPLCIKDILPDFFLIFRVDEATDLNVEDSRFLNYIQREGVLIKSVDLRAQTPIGKYIRNIQTESEKLSGSTYNSMSAEEHNMFSGIAIDVGVCATRYESQYRELNNKISTQFELNKFITDGFERNSLVLANTVNFEYMFDDYDVDNLTINRYFGIYVKCNNLDKIYYLDSSYINQSDYNEVTIPEISTNYLFAATTPYDCRRINYMKDGSINTDIYKELMNKPYENILSCPVSQFTPDSSYVGFLTVQLNEILNPGEHLKIIDNDSKTIYQVIISADKSLIDNDYLSYNTIINYYTNPNDNVEWAVHSISVLGFDSTDSSNIETYQYSISTEIRNIVKAFNHFDAPFVVTSYNESKISFVSTTSNLTFERISEDLISNTSTFTNKDNYLTYFNNIAIPSTTLGIGDISNFALIPMGVEIYGNRIAYVTNFIPIPNDDNSEIYELTTENANSIIKHTLYRQFDSSLNSYSYEQLLNVVSNYIETDEVTTSIVSFNDVNKAMIFANSMVTPNNTGIFFNPYPIDIDLLGIIPVKDYDFNIWNDVNMVSRDEKTILNGKSIYLDTSLDLSNSFECFADYINRNDSSSYYVLNDASSLNEFSQLIYNSYEKKSVAPLVTPVVNKWVQKGNCSLYGIDSLLTLNRYKNIPYLNSSVGSYYIPNSSYYNDISNIGFDMINPNTFVNLSSTKYETLINSFRDSSDFNIDMMLDGSCKYSPTYINGNNLEFISSGIKFNLEIIDTTKNVNLQNYINYNAIFAKTDCYHETDQLCELFIDEVNKNMIYIWHCPVTVENDSSIYALRYNNYDYLRSHQPNDMLIYNIKENDNISESRFNLLSYDVEFSTSKVYSYSYDNSVNINSNSLILNYPSVSHNSVYYDTKTSAFDISADNCYELLKTAIKYTNVYIKTQSGVSEYSSNDFIKVSMIDPILVNVLDISTVASDYYAHSGYFEPATVDILNFDNSVYKLTDTSNIEPYAVYIKNSNTLYSSSNNISQYWINKVSNFGSYCKPNALDYSMSIDVIKNLNPCRSSWDKNYFKQYAYDASAGQYLAPFYLNGYKSGYNVKSFFSSAAINLKSYDNSNNISYADYVIENWGTPTISYNVPTEYTNNTEKYAQTLITLNISEAATNMFLYNKDFINNWANFGNISNVDIITYIQNTLFKIYDINIKNKLTIYQRLKTKKEEVFVNYDISFAELANVEAKFVYKNKNYYINIYVPQNTKYTYSATYNLTI